MNEVKLNNTPNEVRLNTMIREGMKEGNKEVKLNTTGIKFTPSSFITYYEVNTNFSVTDESELLTLEEVKAVLNSYKPQVKRSQDAWCIAVSVPLKDLKRTR
jgi:hypothetical protein